MPPLKRFGQHFLIDRAVRDRLIELAQPNPSDTVIEVGPGLGFLTSALAPKAGRTIAIEKDRALVAYLRTKFSQQQNVEIVEADALKVPIPAGAKIVSSPPYNISSKLVLLIMNSQFQLAALLLQQEFVRRLTAPSGSRDYGRISVMLQCKAKAEFDSKVPRDAFYPKPRVDSALLTIKPTQNKILPKNQELFADLVRALFTQRRRKMRSVLTKYIKTRYGTRSEPILTRIPLPGKRVYEMEPAELVTLSNEIHDASKELERA